MMKTRLRVVAMLCLAVPPGVSGSQERPVRWRVQEPAGEARVRAGGEFRLTLAATVDDGWKLYSLEPQQGGPIATTIELGHGAFSIAGITAPKPEEYPDRNFNIFTQIYRDSTRMDVRVAVAAATKAARYALPVHVRFQTCTDRYCLPPRTDTLSVAVRVSAPTVAERQPPTGQTVNPSNDQTISPSAGQSVSPLIRPTAEPPNGQLAQPSDRPTINLVAPTDFGSFARFIWLAVSMGLLSLLTPCILPMIPITVAYFGGAGADNSRARMRAAFAHAGGIVVAFTALGIAVSVLLGAGGVIRLAANPWINLLIAAFFGAFALNLLGVFEITLPQRLLLGASRLGSNSQRHTAGAILMGVAFAITSFTCTIPFVGTLLVLATQGSWRWPLVGLTAYGVAFALPFFLLALAPRMIDRLPKSGPWMTTMKRSLAVAELALAVKFLSNADLVLGTNFLTRDVVIGLWAAGALAIAALCAAGFRTATGSARIAAIGATAGALLLGAWLGRGVTGARLGELEAYLPPSHVGTLGSMGGGPVVTLASGNELTWLLNDYEGALAAARAERRPVLLDFTGYTCTNCRWMEANMFPRVDVAERLERFVRVRLFTDGIGEPYVSQQLFQQSRFGTVALPYYAVVDTTGAPIATFLGMTRDSREFSRFLEQALNGR